LKERADAVAFAEISKLTARALYLCDNFEIGTVGMRQDQRIAAPTIGSYYVRIYVS
jgi:hypothetical protein